MRLRCADLENRLNAELQKNKTVVAKAGTCQFLDSRQTFAKSASWAERSKLEEEKERGSPSHNPARSHNHGQGQGRRRWTHEDPSILRERARATTTSTAQ